MSKRNDKAIKFVKCSSEPAKFVEMINYLKEEMASEFGVAYDVLDKFTTPIITHPHHSTLFDESIPNIEKSLAYKSYFQYQSDAIRKATALNEKLNFQSYLHI